MNVDIRQLIEEQIKAGDIEPCGACTFPTENDALAYAARLAKLKPGDVVYLRKASGRERCIFMRPCPENGALAVVMFYEDNKELGIGRVGYTVLSLPNEPFVLEDNNDA